MLYMEKALNYRNYTILEGVREYTGYGWSCQRLCYSQICIQSQKDRLGVLFWGEGVVRPQFVMN